MGFLTDTSYAPLWSINDKRLHKSHPLLKISYYNDLGLLSNGAFMNIKTLRKHYNPMPESLELISREGDIYLCRINKKEMLTDNSGKYPMIFHSIGEARDIIGEPLASKLQVVFPTTYDEMINI